MIVCVRYQGYCVLQYLMICTQVLLINSMQNTCTLYNPCKTHMYAPHMWCLPFIYRVKELSSNRGVDDEGVVFKLMLLPLWVTTRQPHQPCTNDEGMEVDEDLSPLGKQAQLFSQLRKSMFISTRLSFNIFFLVTCVLNCRTYQRSSCLFTISSDCQCSKLFSSSCLDWWIAN